MVNPIGMPNQTQQANSAQLYQPQQAQLSQYKNAPMQQQSGGCCNCCSGQTNKVSQLGNGGTSPCGQAAGANNAAKSLMGGDTQSAQKSSSMDQFLEVLLSLIEQTVAGGAKSAAKAR